MNPEFPEYTEAVGACKECGNSPINHAMCYVMASTKVWQSNFYHHFFGTKNSLVRLHQYKKKFERLASRLSFAVIEMTGLARASDDMSKAATYRARVIWEEAIRRERVMQQLVIFGRYTDTYRTKLPDGWHYFEGLPLSVQQNSDLWIDDKFLLKRVLTMHGIATPVSHSVGTPKAALEAFREIGGPVVVKPRSGSRGRHTTTEIHTEGQLDRAFQSAQKVCHYVSVETYLRGSVCRATVVEGRLVGFFKADPPRVTGDGTSTLKELIVQKNAHKSERVQDISLTEENLAFLKRKGFTPESVLGSGVTIDLSHRTGRLFGGETRELLSTVHPRLRTHVEHAASVLNIAIVGFDLIVQDPEADPDTQIWGIIEANTLPFIDLHYLPLHGTPSNPASAVWDLFDKGVATS